MDQITHPLDVQLFTQQKSTVLLLLLQEKKINKTIHFQKYALKINDFKTQVLRGSVSPCEHFFMRNSEQCPSTPSANTQRYGSRTENPELKSSPMHRNLAFG